MATHWRTWPPLRVEAGLPTARLVVGQQRRCDGKEAEQRQSIWDDLLLMCKTCPHRHESRQRLHTLVVSRRPSLHHGRRHRVHGTPDDDAVVMAADVHIPSCLYIEATCIFISSVSTAAITTLSFIRTLMHRSDSRLWGLVEEALAPITDRALRICAYGMLLGVALFAVGVQKQVTVCSLL